MVARKGATFLRPGRSKLGCLVLLALLAIAGYIGVSFGRVYFRYYRFKDDMAQTARFASQLSDTEIQTRLAAAADSLGLPPSARLVQVARIERTIIISATYTERVELPLLVRHFHFTPTIRAPL